MKISLNEIKKLVPEARKVETEELIRLIGSRLVEVEGSEDWADKYRGIYVVKVTECEPIEGTHLHLCQIDAGKPVQVVCGAPNVRAGMFAVWIAPGAIVPQTYGTDEEFEIGARKMRGYESNGMLAGLDELALGDDHSGIVEIDPERSGVRPGADFAEVFDLNDVILDIENKSLTHRPDTFGLIGFAREVAGILGIKFALATGDAAGGSPTGARISSAPVGGSAAAGPVAGVEIEAQIAENDICARYSCAVLDFVEEAKSKYLTDDDVFLAKAGMRGISRIVDATNIIMLKTGQPLHAFDYDKFVEVGGGGAPKIVVRTAKVGEKLELLDGKTIECDENDILITSNDVPVALAGAMGGKNTEIDENTKRIILESATFSLYHLRKTQMKHGIFSEAITRFTKGQPAAQTMEVLEMAISTLGSRVLGVEDCYPSRPERPVISLTISDINSLLGTDYNVELAVKTLENVGFEVEVSGEELAVTAPLWRTDIAIREDVIEEVGRLNGYDNIPLDFPKRPFIGAKQPELLILKNRLREILSDDLNAHEVLTYSFVNKRLQEVAGEDPEDSYEIVNSISPDLQRFRQSLTPSLLEKAAMNLKAGFSDFSLYEINQVTKKSDGLNSENVPEMRTHVAFVTTGDFYKAKTYLLAMLRELGVGEPIFAEFEGGAAYFEPRRSARVGIGADCGEIRGSVLRSLKIGEQMSGFELALEKLLEVIPKTDKKELKFSKFPAVSRDITVKVSVKTTFKAVQEALGQALAENLSITKVEPVSLYQDPKNGSETKNLSFKLTFASESHTLKTEEISAIMEKVSQSVIDKFGAEIV